MTLKNKSFKRSLILILRDGAFSIQILALKSTIHVKFEMDLLIEKFQALIDKCERINSLLQGFHIAQIWKAKQ